MANEQELTTMRALKYQLHTNSASENISNTLVTLNRIENQMGYMNNILESK